MKNVLHPRFEDHFIDLGANFSWRSYNILLKEKDFMVKSEETQTKFMFVHEVPFSCWLVNVFLIAIFIREHTEVDSHLK